MCLLHKYMSNTAINRRRIFYFMCFWFINLMRFLSWKHTDEKCNAKRLPYFDMNYVGFVYNLYIVSEFQTIQTEFNENWVSKRSRVSVFHFPFPSFIKSESNMSNAWNPLASHFSYNNKSVEKNIFFYEKRHRKFF